MKIRVGNWQVEADADVVLMETEVGDDRVDVIAWDKSTSPGRDPWYLVGFLNDGSIEVYGMQPFEFTIKEWGVARIPFDKVMEQVNEEPEVDAETQDVLIEQLYSAASLMEDAVRICADPLHRGKTWWMGDMPANINLYSPETWDADSGCWPIWEVWDRFLGDLRYEAQRQDNDELRALYTQAMELPIADLLAYSEKFSGGD